MAERDAYTRDEVLSMIMCDDDDNLMEHFEPCSDDKLGFNSDVEEYYFKNTHTLKNFQQKRMMP